MTERKMCKFYNLNVPDRRAGDGGVGQNHGGNAEEEERGAEDAQAPPVPPQEHKLEYSYWMWFSRRPPARELSASTTGYGQVRPCNNNRRVGTKLTKVSLPLLSVAKNCWSVLEEAVYDSNPNANQIATEFRFCFSVKYLGYNEST